MVRNLSHSGFVILMFIFITSCCKKSFDDFYFNASDIEIKNTYNFRDISDSVTINQDGYNIKIQLTEDIKDAIENINNVRRSLDYCEDNEVALKTDITSLTISCNKSIWNTQAGSPLDLNNIRIFEYQSEGNTESSRLTVNDWIDLINSKTQFIDFEWYMELNEIINSTELLIFNLHFELKNGSEYITETGLVKFE